MTNAMKQKLEKYIGTNILISIYSNDDDPESYSYGFVIAVDNDFLLLNPVNKYGEEIGFLLINLDSIFLFDTDPMYSEKIMKLFSLKNQQKETLKIIDNSTLFSLFEKAMAQKGLLEINNDSSYIGYVKEYNKELLVLKTMDNFGGDIGLAYMDINHIKIVQYKDMYLRDLELLYGIK